MHTNKIKCACGNNAHVQVTWGVYEIAGRKRDFPMNEACMCNDCAKKMWEQGGERSGYFKHSVQAGHMHYQIDPIA